MLAPAVSVTDPVGLAPFRADSVILRVAASDLGLAILAGTGWVFKRALQHELRRLRPRRETEWHERRPEAGADVHRRAGHDVDAAREAGTEMGEVQLAPRVRQVDLPAVHVSREDEVKGARRETVDETRVVEQQDPEVGVAGPDGELLGLAAPARPAGARIGSGHEHTTPAQID